MSAVTKQEIVEVFDYYFSGSYWYVTTKAVSNGRGKPKKPPIGCGYSKSEALEDYKRLVSEVSK